MMWLIFSRPRILLVSWASWTTCVPPCTQWARELTRPCCRSSESRSTRTITSTAGIRASSSTTMLARSVWAHIYGGVSPNLHLLLPIWVEVIRSSHPIKVIYNLVIDIYIDIYLCCLTNQNDWNIHCAALCTCLCCGINWKWICFAYSPQ